MSVCCGRRINQRHCVCTQLDGDAQVKIIIIKKKKWTRCDGQQQFRQPKVFEWLQNYTTAGPAGSALWRILTNPDWLCAFWLVPWTVIAHYSRWPSRRQRRRRRCSRRWSTRHHYTAEFRSSWFIFIDTRTGLKSEMLCEKEPKETSVWRCACSTKSCPPSFHHRCHLFFSSRTNSLKKLQSEPTDRHCGPCARYPRPFCSRPPHLLL